MVKPRLKKLKNRSSNLANWLLNSEPAPDGLVPIGDTGLYVTPSEPADPRDCDRYPDSPFCGGNPFSFKLLDIGATFVLDECNIGIMFTGAIGFIKMPPVTIVYRKPECRIEIPPLPQLENPDLPFGCGVYVTLTIGGSPVYDDYLSIRSIVEATKISGVYVGPRGFLYEDWIVFYKDGDNNDQQLWNTYTYENDPKTEFEYNTYSGKYLDESALEENRAIPIADSQRNYSPETEGKVLTVHWKNPPYYLISSRCPFQNAATKPPPPKEPCCMGCCPPQDDSLTRLLLKKVALLTEKTEKLTAAVGSDDPPEEPPSSLTEKVNKLSEVIGVDDYPANLPSSLITKVDDNSAPSPPTSVPSLTRLFEWYIKRFDELMGQWEIPIDIEDADATTEGNQGKHIRLPNLSEAIAEMVTLLLQNTINSESLINLTTRTLIEAGMNKQQGFKNYYMLDTLIDYFGFQTKESTQKLSLTFKPSETDLDKLLKECELDVRVTELDDKNTYKSNMQDLLHAAAILRAVHWRKFKNDDSIKDQVVDLIKGYAKTNKRLSGSEKDTNDKDDFDHFLDDAENGFTSTTGITDSTHPYGRNRSERPKIRRIGNHLPTKDT